jgi:hypothetical protein
MAHRGDCDADVQELRQIPRITRQLDAIQPDVLRQELREYGAWGAEELSDHDRNIGRILWLLSWDIKESDEYQEEDEEE